MARHRRRRHRRNSHLICKKVKNIFRKHGGKRHRRKYSGARKGRKGRRKVSAGFKRSGSMMKRVWSKHRAALMKISPKRRFKAAWAFARKMK